MNCELASERKGRNLLKPFSFLTPHCGIFIQNEFQIYNKNRIFHYKNKYIESLDWRLDYTVFSSVFSDASMRFIGQLLKVLYQKNEKTDVTF